NGAGVPLIAPALGILWIGLIAGVLAACRRSGRAGRLARFAVGFAVLALLLLGHPLNEAFYWPVSAAAYVPALAGVAVVTVRLVLTDTGTMAGRDRVICAVALCVAATSVESGMFFVLGFTGVMLASDLVSPRRAPFLPACLRASWYLLPLLVSLGILLCDLAFRVGNATSGVSAQDTSHFHRLVPSTLAALKVMPHRFGQDDGLVVKFLLIAGFAGLTRAATAGKAEGRHLVALAAGLLATVWLTIQAAYFQYGMPGFERHDTFEFCAIALLTLVVGRALSPLWPEPRAGRAGWRRMLAPAALLAALLVLAVPRLPQIVDDYRLLPEIRAVRATTWLSGRAPGASMTFVLPPHGKVLTGSPWQDGTYLLHPPPGVVNPFYTNWAMIYFGKERMTVVDP
ncbi:MAG TPA: hypothetical protein VHB27_19660, partial [Rhodopila sp.]|uniref:hypothetical protein n=1 Tax=Rhodopila sp. TaxID=2480087 RepID=UPI002CFA11DD